MRWLAGVGIAVLLVGLGLDQVGAIGVRPLLIDVALAPGETRIVPIQVINETNNPMLVNGRVEPFAPEGEDGGVAVGGEHTAQSWISGLAPVAIPGGQIATVPITVTVPSTASVGGYYLAVMWQESAPTGAMIGISGRVGTLLLVTVTGDVQESLVVRDFGVVRPDAWYRSEPLPLQLSLENTGTIHVRPTGQMRVTNIFGRVVDTVELNPEAGYILPHSTRRWEITWGGATSGWDALRQEWSPEQWGPLHLRAEMTYGRGNQSLASDQIRVWRWPWRSVTLLALILLSIQSGRHWMRRRTPNTTPHV